MLYLDGSYLEGGGQILRTALALSTLTNQSFEMQHIRQGRKVPGLKNQHLHVIKGLQKLCNSKSANVYLKSSQIKYVPSEIKGGNIKINIETAGSITLLLQSLILPSLFANKKTNIHITGGTDVAWSMQIDYFREVFLPYLTKYANIKLQIEKRGYYPKGQGKVNITIKPKYKLKDYDNNFLNLTNELRQNKPKIDLVSQGKLLQIKGISHASKSLENAQITERQAKNAELILRKLGCPIKIQKQYCDTESPGSGITLWAQFAQGEETDFNNPIILGADVLGAKGKQAELVGEEVANKLLKEIESGAPVDKHLADNLIPFLAINGGEIKVSELSNHTKTNIWTVEQFLGKIFKIKGNTIKV